MSGCSLSAKDKMDAFPEESSNCVSSAVRKACETVDSSTSPPQRQQDGGRSSSDSFHSATSNSSLEFEIEFTRSTSSSAAPRVFTAPSQPNCPPTTADIIAIEETDDLEDFTVRRSCGSSRSSGQSNQRISAQSAFSLDSEPFSSPYSSLVLSSTSAEEDGEEDEDDDPASPQRRKGRKRSSRSLLLKEFHTLCERDDTSRPSSILADELEREESESELLLSPKTIDDDDSLTEEEKKELKKRNEAAREILTTERAYVTYLRVAIDVFYGPLLDKAKEPEPMLNQLELKTIFSNMETILQLNSELLRQLEERMAHWSSKQKIGDIFIALAPFMKVYTEYCFSYDHAADLLNKRREENLNLDNVLYALGQDDRCGSLHNITSYLIMPVQRVPRYSLLLDALLKHTPEDHIDREDLVTALESIRQVTDVVNESVREAEERQKMMESVVGNDGGRGRRATMTGRFQKETKKALMSLGSQFGIRSPTTLIAPHRRHIRDTVLRAFNVGDGTTRKYHVYLFNDVVAFANLLLTSKFEDLDRVVSLSTVWVVYSRSTHGASILADDRSFLFLSPEVSLVLYAKTPQERSQWVDDINGAILSYTKVQRHRELRMQFKPIKRNGMWKIVDADDPDLVEKPPPESINMRPQRTSIFPQRILSDSGSGGASSTGAASSSCPSPSAASHSRSGGKGPEEDGARGSPSWVTSVKDAMSTSIQGLKSEISDMFKPTPPPVGSLTPINNRQTVSYGARPLSPPPIPTRAHERARSPQPTASPSTIKYTPMYGSSQQPLSPHSSNTPQRRLPQPHSSSKISSSSSPVSSSSSLSSSSALNTPFQPVHMRSSASSSSVVRSGSSPLSSHRADSPSSSPSQEDFFVERVQRGKNGVDGDSMLLAHVQPPPMRPAPSPPRISPYAPHGDGTVPYAPPSYAEMVKGTPSSDLASSLSPVSLHSSPGSTPSALSKSAPPFSPPSTTSALVQPVVDEDAGAENRQKEDESAKEDETVHKKSAVGNLRRGRGHRASLMIASPSALSPFADAVQWEEEALQRLEASTYKPDVAARDHAHHVLVSPSQQLPASATEAQEAMRPMPVTPREVAPTPPACAPASPS